MEGRRLKRTRTTLKTLRGQACQLVFLSNPKPPYAICKQLNFTDSPQASHGPLQGNEAWPQVGMRSRFSGQHLPCGMGAAAPRPGAAVAVDVADLPVRCLQSDRPETGKLCRNHSNPLISCKARRGLPPCSCEAKRRRKLPPGATHGMISETHFSRFAAVSCRQTWDLGLGDPGTCHVQRRGG